ncbi:6-pyruvoyl tetrahydropterin synthase family protein [Thermoplasma sp.]|uniref:6-pyruvoyl trahydropterin synthase family protein n=1 Tax=Thermoplasma sp. TaxID=1973142 RepID=UPI00127C5E20|nr:6-pyruvoyl tetrahydropterin synthase family protein [Thermoplasma sp.]KAA8923185.1 MAG: 6-pyruvoyl tetrahydropterin synthase family protein [Thermoplasma sp.]
MRLTVNGWYTNMRFSAAHFIPSHIKCSRLHGHDYGIIVNVEGDMVDGMLIDFIELKNAIRSVINEMDHKLLVPAKANIAKYIEERDEYEISYNDKRMIIPGEFVYLCDVHNTTSEELSAYIARKVGEKLRLKKNIRKIEISVEEGPGQGVFSDTGSL